MGRGCKRASLHLTLVLHAFVSIALTAPLRTQDHSGQYPQADVAAGARVYAALCIGCHGPTGAGVGGIDLRQGPLPRASTDAALTMLLSTGIAGTGMPAFQLSADDTRALVAFIRSGWNINVIAPGDIGRGQAVFEGKGGCLACHRVETRGHDIGPDLSDIGRAKSAASIQRALVDPTGSMMPINRPVRAVTRDGRIVNGRRLNEDTYTVQIMTTEGRLVSLVKSELREWSVGTTSPMPSFKDTLTPVELTDLITYLFSLKGSTR